VTKQKTMRLEMHTYSLYHLGVAEDWAGFRLPWPRQMDIWQLMDYMVELGLEGLHLDDKAFDSMDTAHFSRVRDYARAQNLYLVYNFALPSKKYDSSVQHEIDEGIGTAAAIGADVAKICMNLSRPQPVSASKFHPAVMQQLETVVHKLKQTAPNSERSGVKLAVENHTDAFSEEVIWVLDQVHHPFVGACIDTVNGLHVTENPLTAVENLAPWGI